MDYQEAVHYITELQKNIGSDYSLEPVRRLCGLAGNPDRSLTIVHIAGTNGKGSIGSYLSYILAESGYVVGRYLSPTLLEYRERIQRISPGMAPEYITEYEVAECLTKLRSLAVQMKAQEGMMPTAFEMETVMAFLVMKQWKVDVAILECGMGGRTDATNIILSPVLCLFSRIGYDHTAFLGETLEEIAAEKAGILKQGSQAVSVKQDSTVDAVLQNYCRQQGISLHIADPKEVREIRYDMRETTFCYHGVKWKLGQQGSYQIENAVTAIEAAFLLRKSGFCQIQENTLQAGIFASRLRGRFECVSEDPYVIVDGAHNPLAAAELRRCLEFYFPGEPFTLLCGVFRDKDYLRMMREMLPFAKRIYTVTPPGGRGLPAQTLAEGIEKMVDGRQLEECEENFADRRRLEQCTGKVVSGQRLEECEENFADRRRLEQCTGKVVSGQRLEECEENFADRRQLEQCTGKVVAGKCLAENGEKAADQECPLKRFLIKPCRTVAEALDLAAQEPEKILVFGSLSFLHEVYEYFGKSQPLERDRM